MALELTWMRPSAPYMPIATAGLLAVLEHHGHRALARWEGDGDFAALRIEVDLNAEDVAAAIHEAPWPSLDRISWPGGTYRQALKPTLASVDGSPLRTFRDLIDSAPALEAALLRAILTDGVVDDDGVPGRSRLLRGVKADLSSVANSPKRITVEGLVRELKDGPEFRNGGSGMGLGLVPEVQTFGGTTGPDASTVGAHSPLLYLLLWRGIIALPPLPVIRGRFRVVGGPLVTGPDVLSWPRWRISIGLRSLRTLFSLPWIHEAEPDARVLMRRGVDAVYRAKAVPLNSMVAVFGWGQRVVG